MFNYKHSKRVWLGIVFAVLNKYLRPVACLGRLLRLKPREDKSDRFTPVHLW